MMATSKIVVRREMKALLQGLSEVEKHRQSGIIVQKLLSDPLYREAKRVAIYLNMPNEVRTTELLMSSWRYIILPIY